MFKLTVAKRITSPPPPALSLSEANHLTLETTLLPAGRTVGGLHLRPGGEPVPPAGGAAALPPGRAGAQEVGYRGPDPGQAQPQPHLQAGASSGGEVLLPPRDAW